MKLSSTGWFEGKFPIRGTKQSLTDTNCTKFRSLSTHTLVWDRSVVDERSDGKESDFEVVKIFFVLILLIWMS